MRKFFRLLSVVVAVAIINGACTPLNNTSQPEFIVTIEEPARMRFFGKGAGAGMMLMSSMGPMGIAVGVAIDEGIGKDIDKTASAAEFSIETTVRDAFERAFFENPSAKIISEIKVQRYGFVTRSGERDPVAAQQHLVVVFADGEELLVKYPEAFDEGDVDTAALDEVKVDGQLVVGMHRKVADKIAYRILQQ